MFSKEFSVSGVCFDFLQGGFEIAQRRKLAFPDQGVVGFAAKEWLIAASLREGGIAPFDVLELGFEAEDLVMMSSLILLGEAKDVGRRASSV